MNSNLVIKVEGLSKQYRLGQIGTGTISHDLNRWMAKLSGKEDPYAKVGTVNSRSVKSNEAYAWALKDINFDVAHGDVLGIIGSNGAGKSTLLKLLSRVTSPTTGSIKVKGRIASLLEVGTGFHPEMTGKENIYMNGAILGMSKSEITRKFDEIVDFAGVARYIDTPVKRYSSGMYVRLAFAVAAYLESEILILDEVLAVGDAEFQKKCLGKMGDVANKDGRTVLFVSHNIFAVSAICNKGLLLVDGRVAYNGDINSTIDTYFKSHTKSGEVVIALHKQLSFNGLLNRRELDNLSPNDDINIKFSFEVGNLDIEGAMIDINVYNENKVCVSHSRSLWRGYTFDIKPNKTLSFEYFLKSPKIAPGEYTISIYICKGAQLLVHMDNINAMTINALNYFGGSMYLDLLQSTNVPEFTIEASSN
jgi:lipopolysaccharide transport system ATP-binding protein